MSQRTKWLLILGGCSVLLSLLMQGPQLMHMLSPAYRGVLVPLNSDEYAYDARVEEALQGRSAESAEAIVGDPKLQGTQSAQLEALEGTLFRFTGWSAPVLFQVMDSVIPVLLFLSLWLFLYRSGFSKTQALMGAVLFCILQLYNLNRPLYQRTSALSVFLVFLLMMEGLDRRWWAGVLGGLLLGILMGGYFWGWTFAWIWMGALLLWEVVEWLRSSSLERSSLLHSRWMLLLGFLGVALLTSVPGLIQMHALAANPLSPMAIFRSGLHPSHVPESWVYTVVFFLMAGGIIGATASNAFALRPYRYACVLIIASCIAINQQMIHGIVFNFVSHYLFFLIMGALCVLLLSWRLAFRPRILLLSAAAALLYLAAIGYDGRYVLTQWHPSPADFVDQQFFSLLPVLEQMPRTRILSDPHTSLFLAAYTKQDVAYTLYLKNVLISHRELASRYCLTQLPLPPQSRHLETQSPLLWPDADAAFRDPAIRKEEVRLATEACAALDRSPASALKYFAISFVLWDEKHQPLWDLKRLGVSLEKVAVGDGWSLWRLKA